MMRVVVTYGFDTGTGEFFTPPAGKAEKGFVPMTVAAVKDGLEWIVEGVQVRLDGSGLNFSLSAMVTEGGRVRLDDSEMKFSLAALAVGALIERGRVMSRGNAID